MWQVGNEMAHQLYVLQTLQLGLLEQRMNTKLDPQDSEAHEHIKDLRRIAFDLDGNMGGGDNAARRYSMLCQSKLLDYGMNGYITMQALLQAIGWFCKGLQKAWVQV